MKNKKIIVILSSLVIGSVFVGCSGKSYKNDDRTSNLGVEIFDRQLTMEENNYFEGLEKLLSDMEHSKENEIIIKEAKDKKQDNDMLYGILKDACDKTKNFPNMTTKELSKDFKLKEASTEDMKDFQEKVTPLIKDLNSILNRTISNPNFNGTISDKDLDKLYEIQYEWHTYYDKYLEKVADYMFK